MAGDWTAIEHATPRKPELLTIAADTGLSRHAVLGLLVEFWMWAENMTQDGTIGVSLCSLPAAVGGDMDFWRSVHKAGWLETPNGEESAPVVIPRADHWLTKGAKSRLKKTRSQQERRDRTRGDNAATKRRHRGDKKATTEENRTGESPTGGFHQGSGESRPGGPDSRPSVFSGLTEEHLGSISMLREWLKWQGATPNPILPEPDRKVFVDIVAAAQSALSRGENKVGLFVSIVSRGKFSKIAKAHRKRAAELVDEYLQRRDRISGNRSS